MPSAPDVQKKALGSSSVGSTRNTESVISPRSNAAVTRLRYGVPAERPADVADRGPAG